MSRILRLALVGIVLMLTSLVLDVASVGARWVRLGDANKSYQARNACIGGFWIDFAYINYSDPNSPSSGFGHVYARMYKIDPVKYPGLYVLGYDDPKYAGSIVGEGDVQYSFHEDTLQDKFQTDLGDLNNRHNYGSAFIPWTPEFSDTFPYIAIFAGSSIDSSSTSPAVGAFATYQYQSDCIPGFNDRRSNRYDIWQSAAVYCEDEMVKVYGIDADANGYFAFTVTQADIDKLGIPIENTLLASAPSAFGGNIDLYKLKDTGELQINAPGIPPDTWKEYVFTWEGCG